MRIVFMGSPAFAVPSLVALVDAGFTVPCVYSQPPRPAGRGKSQRRTEVHERAQEMGIEVRTPRTLRAPEEQELFRALEADFAVVAAYGLILPSPILEAPKQGCVNVHASLLPRWRGAAPIQRAILAGDTVSGITIMLMDEGLDTGPILLEKKLEIGGKSGGQVIDEMAHLGADCLIDWLREQRPARPQPASGSTYASKIEKAETRINWANDADMIERQVRAFSPLPGAWFEVNLERFKLLAASSSPGGPGRPGEVIDDHLAIACGSGTIHPLLIQRAGRSPMTPGELLRGFSIPKGTLLA